MIIPPFETARAQSELFPFQCSQWVPIQNSQIIGRYKEMSVWHQVNLMNIPPIWNCQSSEWTLLLLECSQWEHIWNSQIIGRYKEMSVWHQVNVTNIPPIQNCQSSEWTLRFSMQSMRAHSKQSNNRKI